MPDDLLNVTVHYFGFGPGEARQDSFVVTNIEFESDGLDYNNGVMYLTLANRPRDEPKIVRMFYRLSHVIKWRVEELTGEHREAFLRKE